MNRNFRKTIYCLGAAFLGQYCFFSLVSPGVDDSETVTIQ